MVPGTDCVLRSSDSSQNVMSTCLGRDRQSSGRIMMAETRVVHSWAYTCDFQQCGILTSVDSDEPVYPPFKHRKSK